MMLALKPPPRASLPMTMLPALFLEAPPLFLALAFPMGEREGLREGERRAGKARGPRMGVLGARQLGGKGRWGEGKGKL